MPGGILPLTPCLADLPQCHSALGFLYKHQVKPLFENNRVTVTRNAADLLAKVFLRFIGNSFVRAA